MYHLGIVRHVISPGSSGTVAADTSVQAAVRMWDDNLLILGVEAKIGSKLKAGDYVIADYSPMAAQARHRKLLITKILSQKDGSKLWAEFQDEWGRRRSMAQQYPQQGQVMR
jgi:hypothetical protein